MSTTNHSPDFSEEKCWWVCKVCKEVIEIQQESVLKELEIWDDRRITGGEDWFPEIEKAIETARIAILMITANFLTSQFKNLQPAYDKEAWHC